MGRLDGATGLRALGVTDERSPSRESLLGSCRARSAQRRTRRELQQLRRQRAVSELRDCEDAASALDSVSSHVASSHTVTTLRELSRLECDAQHAAEGTNECRNALRDVRTRCESATDRRDSLRAAVRSATVQVANSEVHPLEAALRRAIAADSSDPVRECEMAIAAQTATEQLHRDEAEAAAGAVLRARTSMLRVSCEVLEAEELYTRMLASAAASDDLTDGLTQLREAVQASAASTRGETGALQDQVDALAESRNELRQRERDLRAALARRRIDAAETTVVTDDDMKLAEDLAETQRHQLQHHLQELASRPARDCLAALERQVEALAGEVSTARARLLALDTEPIDRLRGCESDLERQERTLHDLQLRTESMDSSAASALAECDRIAQQRQQLLAQQLELQHSIDALRRERDDGEDCVPLALDSVDDGAFEAELIAFRTEKTAFESRVQHAKRAKAADARGDATPVDTGAWVWRAGSRLGALLWSR